jgi:hypothetical protein
VGIFDRFREGAGVQRPIPPSVASEDEQAIARYRYMLKTAPPETIEQAHAEAFGRLTPDQRRRVLQELSNEAPDSERAAVMRAGDNPQQLARVATRAEIRQPGVMERVLGTMPSSPAAGGIGIGGLMAGSLLSSMAGTVLGSMIAQHFFSHDANASNLFGDGVGADQPLHDAFNAPTYDESAGIDDPLGDDGFNGDGGFDSGTFDV